MPRMDSLDSAKNKLLFKKRIHRPWNPDSLAGTENESTELPTEISAADYNNFEIDSLELQQMLSESSPTRSETSSYTNIKHKMTIGGFLSPQNVFYPTANEQQIPRLDELKNKEQEILLQAQDLKIEKALEYAKQIYLLRKKEEEARKSAENKALFAIQQARISAEQVHKVEQQLVAERRLRLEGEKTKKQLEEQMQQSLREIKDLEQAKLEAEEKINKILQKTADFENNLQLETEKKIIEFRMKAKETEQKAEENVRTTDYTANEKIRQAYLQAEEKISHARLQADEKIRISQENANEQIKQAYAQIDQKIKDIETRAEASIKIAQEQAHFHEKSKNTAQTWIQKHLETAEKAEAAKNDYKSKYETISKTSQEQETLLKRKIDTLTNQINQLENQKIIAEHERDTFSNQISFSLDTVKRMETIVLNERNLRKVLEQKYTDSFFRDEETKRKLIENKLVELTKKVGDTEIEKSKVEENLMRALENVHKLEIMIESEKILKKSLEDQVKEFMHKVHNLENSKQAETEAKQAAESKVSILEKEKKFLAQEKAEVEDKVRNSHARAMESEKIMKKSIEELVEKLHSLENSKQAATEAKQMAECKVSILENETQHLIQEKSQVEDKLNQSHARSKDLELMLENERRLRQKAENQIDIERDARRAAQEKINRAIEKANRTVLSVLGSGTTIDSSNADT